jgi:transposase
MSQKTVFSGRQRPRRWSDEERARMLTEAFSPRACVAAVARQNDISTGLIYQWRDKLRGRPESRVFVEAVVDGASDQEGPGGIKVVISELTPPVWQQRR